MKKSHGGKRKGAGRKKKEPTKTIRVPEKHIPAIKDLIKKK
jgi:hypothetical protein